MIGKARNCIFILLTGAPSGVDTFDLKVGTWTPTDFNPTSYNGVMFPQGLMPKLAERAQPALQSSAVSARQRWCIPCNRPGRRLRAARLRRSAKSRPNIGSVVALEFETQRKPNQKLPVFVSLNTGRTSSAPGYFNGLYSPFDVTAAPNGHDQPGQCRWPNEVRTRATACCNRLIRGCAQNSPLGDDVTTMGSFYDRGKGMMYDPAWTAVFKFTTERADERQWQQWLRQFLHRGAQSGQDRIRARVTCRSIRQLGSSPGHLRQSPKRPIRTCPAFIKMTEGLDIGLSHLIDRSGRGAGVNGGTLLDETLIVAMGEFGRTVGRYDQPGRARSLLPAFRRACGRRSRGGRIIGETTADGGNIKEAGWSQGRPTHTKTSRRRSIRRWALITRRSATMTRSDAVSSMCPLPMKAPGIRCSNSSTAAFKLAR